MSGTIYPGWRVGRFLHLCYADLSSHFGDMINKTAGQNLQHLQDLATSCPDRIQDPQDLATSCQVRIQDPQDLAITCRVRIQDPQDLATSCRAKIQDPQDLATSCWTRIQDPQDLATSDKHMIQDPARSGNLDPADPGSRIFSGSWHMSGYYIPIHPRNFRNRKIILTTLPKVDLAKCTRDLNV